MPSPLRAAAPTRQAPPCESVRTLSVKRSPHQTWASRKGEANYDAEVAGRRDKKSRRWTTMVPVLKLTQVGEMNILRRSRERS